MVVPLEPDDQPPPGVGAGQPDRACRRPRCPSWRTAPCRPRAPPRRPCGPPRSPVSYGSAEAGPELGDRARDGLGHSRVPVAEDHRAQAEQVVDVLVAVDVAQPRPGPSAMNGGYGFQPNFTVRALLPGATGNVPAGLGEQLAGTPCPVPVPLIEGSLVQDRRLPSLSLATPLRTIRQPPTPLDGQTCRGASSQHVVDRPQLKHLSRVCLEITKRGSRFTQCEKHGRTALITYSRSLRSKHCVFAAALVRLCHNTRVRLRARLWHGPRNVRSRCRRAERKFLDR